MNNKKNACPRWLWAMVRLFRWLFCMVAFAVLVTVAWRWVMPEKINGLFDVRGLLAWLMTCAAAEIFALRKPNDQSEPRSQQNNH